MLSSRRIDGGGFGRTDNPDNLFVRESLLLHVGPPQGEENLTYQVAKFWEALQIASKMSIRVSAG
jgi:hypothetical protein